MKSSNYIKPKLIDTEVRDIVLVKNGVIPPKIKPPAKLIPFNNNPPIINIAGGSLVSENQGNILDKNPIQNMNNNYNKGYFDCLSKYYNDILWFVVLFSILGFVLYTRYKMKKEQEKQLYILYLKYLQNLRHQKELKRALEEKKKTKKRTTK